MPKLCPKLVVEGTRLTGKTDLVFALSEHPALVGPRKYRYHTPIVSAEWCGFTDEPWGRGIINYAPDEAARAMETYQTWTRLFALLPHYAWFVDRFHLATRAWQETAGGTRAREALSAAVDAELESVDDALAARGFRLVLCTRRDDTFEAARAERLKISGNPGQYDHLQRFRDEQRRLRELAVASRLEVLELDMTDATPTVAAERVVAWMAG